MMWDYTGVTVRDISADEYRCLARNISVTRIEDLCKVLDVPLNRGDSTTDLTDIDDDMVISEDVTSVDLTGAIKPDLPTNNYNIRTLTNEVLAEMRQSNSYSTEWVAVPHHL